MGKIYEYSEITQRRVPQPQDFLHAKELVIRRLADPVKNGEIYGGRIFGTVAIGTPNNRSDLDVLVITEQDSVLNTLQKIFNTIHKETNVCIEPLLIDKQLAQLGFHSVDEFYLRAIESMPLEGNLAGRDPLGVMRPHRLSRKTIYEEYLIQKIRRFKEGFLSTTYTERVKVLQRALEAPVHIGRRTLLMYPEFRKNILGSDNPQVVIQSFREAFQNTGLIQTFEHLLSQDIFYTEYLRKSLSGHVNEREYETTILSLVNDCVPQAERFTTDVSWFFMNRLEGVGQTTERQMFRSGRKEQLL